VPPRALAILVAVAAALVAAGGSYGYAKTGSVASIAASGAAAALWAVAAVGIARGAGWGRGVALAVGAVLAVVMGAKFAQGGNPMPALPVVGLSLVVVVATLLGRSTAGPR
jgi:uncharacterized membrane protein (UPF0136 family)